MVPSITDVKTACWQACHGCVCGVTNRPTTELADVLLLFVAADPPGCRTSVRGCPSVENAAGSAQVVPSATTARASVQEPCNHAQLTAETSSVP